MNPLKVINNQNTDLNILFAGDLCSMGQIEQVYVDDTQDDILI
jgi:hypothetical protein